MNDRKPSRSNDTDGVPSDMPDEIERHERPPEGGIPGLPVSSDPLLQPQPRPAPREVPPLD
jgi:hypothetical protein